MQVPYNLYATYGQRIFPISGIKQPYLTPTCVTLGLINAFVFVADNATTAVTTAERRRREEDDFFMIVFLCQTKFAFITYMLMLAIFGKGKKIDQPLFPYFPPPSKPSHHKGKTTITLIIITISL